MFEPMLRFLRSQGYRILQINRGNKPGPDILAEKSGKKLIVQMKGDSMAIKTDWDTGLGQLLEMMENDKSEYVMVVSKRYERLVKTFPIYPKERLCIRFLIVGEDGTVREMAEQ